MFLPTTLDSAEQIVEAIQQIKEKIPADPLEADLILMAELVAEGNQKDEEETSVPSTSPADGQSKESESAFVCVKGLGWCDK